jgi:integrase
MAGGKLTKLQVNSLHLPGRYADGQGLYLQISRWGTKAWVLRFQIDGQPRLMGLGSVSKVSLATARLRAQAAHERLVDGRDPIELRKAERAERLLAQAKAMNFREAAMATIAAFQGQWDNPETRRQWLASLETYVFPVLGSLPVSAVDTALVVKAIEPLWSSKRTTANRLRARIESVLSWATVRGLREGDNPARWRGHLSHLLAGAAAKTAHHKAMPYAQVPSFMAKLRTRKGSSARALEFLILTAVRTSEAIGARWSEIDGDIWTVPAARMKARQAHRVPLSTAAMVLLDELAREDEFVFIGRRAGRPLDRHAMAETLEVMGVAVTTHGFRSTFRDWAAECTSFPGEIAEQALAHKVPNKVEAAYRRGDLLQKRHRLMQAWADFCGSPNVEADVIPIGHGRADG